jgi:hypothetical protein
LDLGQALLGEVVLAVLSPENGAEDSPPR